MNSVCRKGLLLVLLACPLSAKTYILTARGDSMLPTITNPAIVVAVDVPYRSLRKGDIVVYRDGRGRSIQHRLVRRTLIGWVAKGDNNPREDPELVTRKNYIAKVTTNK